MKMAETLAVVTHTHTHTRNFTKIEKENTISNCTEKNCVIVLGSQGTYNVINKVNIKTSGNKKDGFIEYVA